MKIRKPLSVCLFLIALSLTTGRMRAAETSKEKYVREVEVTTAEELSQALEGVKPGDRIRLHTGTYAGKFALRSGGTKAHPVCITAFGDGEVKIAPSAAGLKPIPPDYKEGCAIMERTLSFYGTDQKPIAYVELDGLVIEGGVYAGPEKLHAHSKWNRLRKAVCEGKKLGWIAMEGRLKQYFVSEKIPVDQWPEALGIYAQNLTIRNNTMTKRGIALWHVADSVIERNIIKDSENIVPGIVLQQACSRNVIKENNISGMNSPVAHWHGEGIRLVNFCVKNRIEHNFIHDIRGAGFGITADLYADCNLYKGNVVENIESIAFTDQWANSGNEWVANCARNCAIGYDFASWWWERPIAKSASFDIKVKNNKAEQCRFTDCIIGCIASIQLEGNHFKRLNVSPIFQEGFATRGCSWNGSDKLPEFVSTDRASRFVKLF